MCKQARYFDTRACPNFINRNVRVYLRKRNSNRVRRDYPRQTRFERLIDKLERFENFGCTRIPNLLACTSIGKPPPFLPCVSGRITDLRRRGSRYATRRDATRRAAWRRWVRVERGPERDRGWPRTTDDSRVVASRGRSRFVASEVFTVQFSPIQSVGSLRPCRVVLSVFLV